MSRREMEEHVPAKHVPAKIITNGGGGVVRIRSKIKQKF
jgi:hypothetical protein